MGGGAHGSTVTLMLVAAAGAGLLVATAAAELPGAAPHRTLRSAWESPDAEGSYCVAWADWDGDGDPDPAFGDKWDLGLNHVYTNEDGTFVLVWTAPVSDATESNGLDWADWDGDGDLDLAVGNDFDQPNRVYENLGGDLMPAWSSQEAGHTIGVAWADYDGDGDMDLACANKGPNRVYENVPAGD
jgi:hypothetical protein